MFGLVTYFFISKFNYNLEECRVFEIVTEPVSWKASGNKELIVRDDSLQFNYLVPFSGTVQCIKIALHYTMVFYRFIQTSNVQKAKVVYSHWI